MLEVLWAGVGSEKASRWLLVEVTKESGGRLLAEVGVDGKLGSKFPKNLPT